MKLRRSPRPLRLAALLLALVAAPACAEDSAFAFINQAMGKLAQYSAEERRAMRERWEQSSPEERLQMRREYQERQERMRSSPTDPRREAAESEQRRGRGRGRSDRAEEFSFGFGFERRRQEEEQLMPPMNMPDPSGFFDRRDNRDSERRR